MYNKHLPVVMVRVEIIVAIALMMVTNKIVVVYLFQGWECRRQVGK